MRSEKTKKITVLAMLSALAYVVVFLFHFIGISFIPAAPFLSYDPKDVILAIGGFLYGPFAALATTVVVCLIEMVTISDTGIIGFAMNALSSCAFACTAAWFYKNKRSLSGAVTGLCLGVLLMVAVMLGWNYLLTPMYMNQPRAEVAKLLLPAFLPFNLIKGGLNACITAFAYRPIVQSLRHAGLFPKSNAAAPEKRRMTLFYLGATAALLLCTLAIYLLGR